jgi:hypothetical protein
METEKRGVSERIDRALKDEEVPRIYFNGFANTIGTGDTLVVLEWNNRPVAILSTSHTVAKTLAEKLAGSIAFLEKKTDVVIMTTDDIEKIVKREVSDVDDDE